MKASSLSGECASLISIVFGEAAGVDILGPPGSQETRSPTAAGLGRRFCMAVVPAAVKVTKVWTSSGVSAESMQGEDNTAEASAYRGRRGILSP
jgi:hypothetical protein